MGRAINSFTSCSRMSVLPAISIDYASQSCVRTCKTLSSPPKSLKRALGRGIIIVSADKRDAWALCNQAWNANILTILLTLRYSVEPLFSAYRSGPAFCSCEEAVCCFSTLYRCDVKAVEYPASPAEGEPGSGVELPLCVVYALRSLWFKIFLLLFGEPIDSQSHQRWHARFHHIIDTLFI